ncbi:MAG: hypothetical protein AB2L11_04695 [Syntrophobacteraceae bacterium]
METKQSEPNRCFTPVSGMTMVYEPGCGVKQTAKKHPCPDCHYCQYCSESRCNSCRGKKNTPATGRRRKLSLHEQILLFEEINSRG